MTRKSRCFMCGRTAPELVIYDVCDDCARAQREEEIRQAQEDLEEILQQEQRTYFATD